MNTERGHSFLPTSWSQSSLAWWMFCDIHVPQEDTRANIAPAYPGCCCLSWPFFILKWIGCISKALQTLSTKTSPGPSGPSDLILKRVLWEKPWVILLWALCILLNCWVPYSWCPHGPLQPHPFPHLSQLYPPKASGSPLPIQEYGFAHHCRSFASCSVPKPDKTYFCSEYECLNPEKLLEM